VQVEPRERAVGAAPVDDDGAPVQAVAIGVQRDVDRVVKAGLADREGGARYCDQE
jgi:hypothetical protein